MNLDFERDQAFEAATILLDNQDHIMKEVGF